MSNAKTKRNKSCENYSGLFKLISRPANLCYQQKRPITFIVYHHAIADKSAMLLLRSFHLPYCVALCKVHNHLINHSACQKCSHSQPSIFIASHTHTTSKGFTRIHLTHQSQRRFSKQRPKLPPSPTHTTM